MKRIYVAAALAVALMACARREAPIVAQEPRPVASTDTPAPGPATETVETPTDSVKPAGPNSSVSVTPAVMKRSRSSELSRIDLAATVLDPSSLNDPFVREAYGRAREVADRLDQMYCYCRCKENENLQHKSLLTCFQDEHAASCGICLNEGKQAWLDWKDDVSVETTIKTVDLMYNQGKPAPSMPHVH